MPWQNLLSKLSQSPYPYIIVGGAAMAMHGIPRSTLDIDIFIPAETKTIEWFFSFCESNNLQCQDKDIKKLVYQPKILIGQWLTFANQDNINIVDIFIENDNDFQQLLKHAKKISAPKGKFTIVGIKDLLTLKSKSNRPVDQADIELIKKWKLLK